MHCQVNHRKPMIAAFRYIHLLRTILWLTLSLQHWNPYQKGGLILIFNGFKLHSTSFCISKMKLLKYALIVKQHYLVTSIFAYNVNLYACSAINVAYKVLKNTWHIIIIIREKDYFIIIILSYVYPIFHSYQSLKCFTKGYQIR